MALSLPTTSNTPGSWSNAAVSNTLTASFFTRDSKFASSTGVHEYNGSDVAISANGDYAVIGNRAWAAGGVEKGFPFIVARSGNTWTQQAILSNQSSYELSGNRASEYENKYGYPGAQGTRSLHGIDIDDAGDTVVVAGKNYDQNNYAGRVEIWERSGSTWSFSAGIDAGSGTRTAWEGIRLAPDGLSFITANGNSKLYRFEKSGGSWSVDSNNANLSFGGSAVAYNGSKISGVNLGLGILYTRYWNGSSWVSSSNVAYGADSAAAGYGNPPGIRGMEMTSDGNYLFILIYGADSAILVFEWDASVNNWVYSTALIPTNQDAGSLTVRRVTVNSDGTKLLAAGDSATKWYSFERSGSTWTETALSRTRGGWAIALSDDGMHAIVGKPGDERPELGPNRESLIEYFQPTGVIASAISNGSVVAHQGRRFRWNASKNRWTPANKVNLTGVTTSRSRSAGVASSSLSGETLSINGLTVDVGEFAGKTTTYANASIFPFSSLQAGDQAIALDTGYLYVTDGSGWFRVANSAIVT